MNFHQSEQHLAIQDAVRGTLAQAWPIERLHAYAEGDRRFDPPSWQALMALGLGGLLLPEAAGGAGLGLVDAAMVAEVLGEAVAPNPVVAQMLTARAIHASGVAEAQQLLAAIAAGETVATLAWDDDPVESAQAAGVFLRGTHDGGLALVLAGDGVAITPLDAADRAQSLARVAFDGARTIDLFAPGDPAVATLYDAALVLGAAEALGGAQRCLDMAVAYAGQREQFGVTIGRFQAVKHQLAQMALEVEPARALVWYAAYAQDAALPDARRAAALAKAHLADRFVSVARAAVAVHGGIGYTWEHGLHYWLRRSIALSARLGNPARQRARAAALAGW
jgi:alkylation response protein AidB-like acyl-CoA dehydrogenase